MREEFNLLNNSCGTLTVPATETKSKGQAADAQGVMVFASPFRQLYRDMTNPAHLSGPRHLDNFIAARNFRPSTRTGKKHGNATQTAPN
jgi:hypothetical protein